MYVEQVRIRDLRCFEDVTVGFVHPGMEGGGELDNVTLLLGDNGVGKTTVLRAIALGGLNVALEQAGYVPYSMVRRAKVDSPVRGRVMVETILHDQDVGGELTGRQAAEGRSNAIFLRKGDVEKFDSVPVFRPVAEYFDLLEYEEQLYSDESPGVLILGYGATRRVDPASEFSPRLRRKQRLLRYERVSSLFEEQVALAPLAGWLPDLARAKPKLYSRICELLDRLIPADTTFTGEFDGGEYLFERGGVKVGFAALSDGYRGYIGLLGDLFYHLCTGLSDKDNPTDSRGIVLIDEIGLHLHPSWQRVVIPTLARTLPNLQFVLTTHSPIIAGTVYARNVRLFEADERGLSHLEPLDEEIHGLNADQILLTEAFGLESSRSPDFVEKFERRSRELDPDNWKDALELMRMYNRGSAGEREEPELPEAPAWADAARRQLAGIVKAEDRPAKKKSSKKKNSKKSSKKKSSKKKRS